MNRSLSRVRVACLALTITLAACGNDETAHTATDTNPSADVATAPDGLVVDTTATDAHGADTGSPCIAGAPCDDLDPCTLGERCVANTCQGGVDLCACRVDADCQVGFDRCLGARACDLASHTCRLQPGTAVTCDTSLDGHCQQTVCDPASGTCGANAAFDGTWCNDGNPCTVGDACLAGACAPGAASACACQADADCKDDGDLCNGEPFCNKAVYPFVCAVNPATVVSCAASKAPCQQAACDPATGSCSDQPAPDLSPCSDGDSETVGDGCVGGACKGSVLGVCLSDSDCASKEDGDVCNGTLYCDKASQACAVNPGSVVVCPTVDDTACAKRLCQPQSGLCQLLPINAGKACDDGDVCTTGDICDGGGCGGGTDTCLCASDADCQQFEDGNVCNGKMFCNKGLAKPQCQVNPATVVLCPTVEDTACNKAACVPLSGACSATAVELTFVVCDPLSGVCRREQRPKGEVGVAPGCEDGEVCTAGDICAGGTCVAGTNICACSADDDCAQKTDGDLCKGPWYCDKTGPLGVCKPNPAKAVVCPTALDTACLKTLCQPTSGLCKATLVETGTSCDDGDVCTAGTYCVNGGCQGGAKVCECTSHADCETKFGDADLCNGSLYCDKSGLAPKCKLNPASVVECPANSGSVCLISVCNPATGGCGWKAGNTGKVCDDGSPCSVEDACAGGVCAGVKNACGDGDPCTTDGCDTNKGCVHAPLACDDANPCTSDACVAGKGICAHTAVGDGKGCDADGDGCTVGDACAAGACKAGPKAVCKGDAGPCEQPVCVSQGAASHGCSVVSKAEGAACAGAGGCTLDAVCAKGACVPGSKERLYAKPLTLGEPLTAGDISLHAVVAVGEGAMVVGQRVGAVNVGGKDVTEGRWLIASVDASGATTSATALVPLGAQVDPEAGAVGAMATDDGVVVVAGSAAFADVGRQVVLLGINAADGKVMWQQSSGGAGHETARRLRAHPAGGWLVLGAAAAGAQVEGLALRTSAGGVASMLWSGGGAGDDVLLDGVGFEDGATVACGARGTLGGSDGWLVRLDAGGKLAWSQQQGTAAVQQLEGIARLPDGALLAVGWSQDGPLRHPWWLRLGSGGQVSWQRTSAAAAYFRDVAVRSSGSAVLVGAADPSGQAADARLAALDGAGLLVWQRLYDGGAAEQWAAVALDDAGAALVVGRATPAKGPSVGLLGRTDAWGRSSCASAGVCFAKAEVACADAKACTDDLCDASTGCVAAPNSKACEDGDLCTGPDLCGGGTCASGGPQTCDDANACTADTCDKAKGCVHVAQGGGCPDDSACTKDESCAAGVCKVVALDCDDGDACSVDACDKLKGCTHAAVADETPCGAPKICIEGKCVKRWAVQLAAKYRQWESSTYDLFCARHPQGTVSCFSSNPYTHAPSATWSIGNITDASALTVGGTAGCVETTAGEVRCFGYPWFGGSGSGPKLGIEACGGKSSFAVVVPGALGVSHIDVGGDGVCGLNTKGESVCWGRAASGSVGNGVCGNGKCQGLPIVVPALANMKSFGMGHFHGCGIDGAGHAWCWGGGGGGGSGEGCSAAIYLGDGTLTKYGGDPAKQVTGLADVAQIAGAVSHTCAVTKAGAAYCWGANAFGELGDGTKTDRATPVPVYQLGKGVVRIVPGPHHTCALLADGTVRCWGANAEAALGDGTTFDSAVPVAVKDLTSVVDLALGYNNGCALRKDGAVYCWGSGLSLNGPKLLPGSAP